MTGWIRQGEALKGPARDLSRREGPAGVAAVPGRRGA
jgi:hypothetical protein